MKKKIKYSPSYPNYEEPFESTFTKEEYASTVVTDDELKVAYAEFLEYIQSTELAEFEDQDDAHFVLSRVWDGSFECDDVYALDDLKDTDGRTARLSLTIHDPKAKLKDVIPTMKCKVRRENGVRKLDIELKFTAKKFSYKRKTLSEVCYPCSAEEYRHYLKFKKLSKLWHEKKMQETKRELARTYAQDLAKHYRDLERGPNPTTKEAFIKAVIGV